MRWTLMLSMCLLLGCGPAALGEGPAESSFAVLDPAQLLPVAIAADPLHAHRPYDVRCPPAAFGEEGGGFEVQTGVCNYAAFAQPVGRALSPGDTLAISVWHDTLDSAEPGTGHLAVLLDEDVVWEVQVEIPSESRAYDVLVPIMRPLPNPTLGLHLHNHGFNSWRFVAIDVHSSRE